MMRRRAILTGLILAPLAACGSNATSIWAPDDSLEMARYRAPGPTYLALVTVRNEGDGQGAHTALLINASERVLFDPYGGWTDPAVPERNDVLFGFSPEVEARYLNCQAKDGYYYVRQEIQVAPEVTEQALALAKVPGLWAWPCVPARPRGCYSDSPASRQSAALGFRRTSRTALLACRT